MQAISLRPAQAADSERCQAIAVAAWTPIYASSRRLMGDAVFFHLFPRWEERKAGQIAASFERHLEWVVVAVAPAESPAAEERIVGFATYRLDPQAGVGEIGNNAVDPEWQGHGIAGQLYRELLARFRAAGMRVAKVTTGLDEAHAPARAAYRKVGFEAGVSSVTYYQEL